jgi:hypothetical protein
MSSKACGAWEKMRGIISRKMAALAPASCRRVWPGRCLAPAVITAMPASPQSSSGPAFTSTEGTNIEPCVRTLASASAFDAFRSVSTILCASPCSMAA